MKPTRAIVVVCAATLAAVPAAALAHHSAAMYDHDKTVTVDGAVKDWQFTQPHTYLEVVANDAAGAVTVWGLESAGPSAVERAGVKRNTFKPGDKVTVKIHPLKDGRPGGSIISVTTAGGKVYEPARAFFTPGGAQ